MIRKIFRDMLFVQIISAMTVTICMLIDSIMIGRFLGVDSMTAYGLSTPVLLVFAAFGSMVSAGIQMLCGKAMGIGDSEGTDACYTVSLLLAGGVSLVGLVLVLALTGPICRLLGAGQPVPENEVFFLTQDYLRGFIIGAPAFIFAQIMVPYMQIAGKRTLLVVAVLAMTVSDVVFDLLNVFVFHGGTFGMGLASSLSYYVAFAIGITYFIGKKCMFHFRKGAVKAAVAADLLKSGVPTVVNQISLVLLVFLLNKVLLRSGGNHAVAAYSVISTLGNICYCFGSGVGSVALTLSAIFFNDEDRSAVYSLIRIMTVYAVILNVIVIAVVWLLAPYMVRLFITENAAVGELAKRGLRLFSLSLLSSALNTTYKNYYQGIGRIKLSETISVLQNFLFTALFAFVLSRFIGTDGVWIAFVLGETTTLILLVIYVWVRNKKPSFTAVSFSLLPEGYGVPENDCMEASIRSMNDTVSVSEQAEEFCLQHGESRRNSMMIALCIEEMAVNIVKHGFQMDQKEHSIDLRVVFKNGSRVIRIRDNCIGFDPVNYMELHQADDASSHIGIRMVMKMVREASYLNSLGLNNLTLVL